MTAYTVKPLNKNGTITHTIRPTNINSYDYLVTIDGMETELPFHRYELEIINENRKPSAS